MSFGVHRKPAQAGFFVGGHSSRLRRATSASTVNAWIRRRASMTPSPDSMLIFAAQIHAPDPSISRSPL